MEINSRAHPHIYIIPRFHPSTYHFALKKVEGSRLVVVKALRDLVPLEGPVRVRVCHLLH